MGKMGNVAALKEINAGLSGLIAPPRRMSVVDAANENLYVSPTQTWDGDLVPYMHRPMIEMASRLHDVVCFSGPARIGKTVGLILGGYVYTVICHPQDFAIIHSSKSLARDLSNREITRLHVNSPGMRAAQTGRSKDDNTHDKTYKSGVIGIISWPSLAELASRTIPVMLLTDYGRWMGDIGGQGSGFEQARKRTQTAGSLAMTVVESAPGCVLSPDDDSEPQVYTPGKPLNHAFPATVSGVRADICPIFNAGTREWWYVPCASCGEYYPQSPEVSRFSWGSGDPVSAARTAGTLCPWCGTVHGEETKRAENENGRWLAEGQIIDCNGKITGDCRIGHTYPSFALGGGAAAYQTRQSIALKYLTALELAKQTGDETNLQTAANGDMGAVHHPIAAVSSRARAPLKKRAERGGKAMVPAGVRFLVAAIDTQINRFVVQVVGHGEDRNQWVVDRYNIRRSARPLGSGFADVDPATYAEDWWLLTKLLNKTYLLDDDSGRGMQVAMVGCDSSGLPGVTGNAYAYFRSLTPQDKSRFRLIKGEPKPGAPTVEQRWPDTRNKKDRGASRGDVPVLFVGTNRLKDILDSELARDDRGTGYIHFPDWLPDWWYAELTREKRGSKGQWAGNGKNEAWDLLVYARALAIVGIPFGFYRARMIGIDSPGFWDKPPRWAADLDKNQFVSGPDAPSSAHDQENEVINMLGDI